MDLHRLDRLLAQLQGRDDGSTVLGRICTVCVDVTETAGAGVSRIFDGRHETLASTDPWAGDIEALQATLAEGPCLDAVHSYRPLLEADLASAESLRRWPRFASAAVELGVGAAFAFPLISGGVAIGALDLYARKVGGLADDNVEDTLILAGLAGLAVERLGPASVSGVDLTAEPVEDWAYPSVVHNASGMVSEQLGIDVDQALLRIRALAFATDRQVSDVARAVVERSLRLDAWTDNG